MRYIETLKSMYLDSVSLMRISQTASRAPGVIQAVVSMGTDTNLNLMREIGFDLKDAGRICSNDLVIAVEAEDRDAADRAVETIRNEIKGGPRTREEDVSPRSLEAAIREHPEINLVVISVPGRYAAYEASRALSAGRHVMIFSDNVSTEDEKKLKEIGVRKGLLVMGPDCGTALIGGVGLGFANQVPRGEIGIVSASGTGAQEVSAVLARLGLGVSHIIGTGGRDVSCEIDAAMMKMGLSTLADDAATKVIVIISKAPDPAVAGKILDVAGRAGKPCIAYFAGQAEGVRAGGMDFASTLTETALKAAEALTGKRYARPSIGEREALVAQARARLAASRRFLRGLYSGGTLAQEAMFVLRRSIGNIRTNMHVEGFPVLEDAAASEGHTILDLGDDVFTRGRAHPMIDQAQRLARIVREAEDPGTGVILLDVVLGYGCNDDPAGEIAGTLAKIAREGGRDATVPAVVASICGTRGDPQDYERQRKSLESEGALVAPTNALACELACDILAGDSDE